MSEDELRQALVDALADIAPEVDPAELDGAVPLQEQIDLDSMDMLELLTTVGERAGVDIPERDYAEVATLDGCVRYLAQRTPARTSPEGVVEREH